MNVASLSHVTNGYFNKCFIVANSILIHLPQFWRWYEHCIESINIYWSSINDVTHKNMHNVKTYFSIGVFRMSPNCRLWRCIERPSGQVSKCFESKSIAKMIHFKLLFSVYFLITDSVFNINFWSFFALEIWILVFNILLPKNDNED